MAAAAPTASPPRILTTPRPPSRRPPRTGLSISAGRGPAHRRASDRQKSEGPARGDGRPPQAPSEPAGDLVSERSPPTRRPPPLRHLQWRAATPLTQPTCWKRSRLYVYAEPEIHSPLPCPRCSTRRRRGPSNGHWLSRGCPAHFEGYCAKWPRESRERGTRCSLGPEGGWLLRYCCRRRGVRRYCEHALLLRPGRWYPAQGCCDCFQAGLPPPRPPRATGAPAQRRRRRAPPSPTRPPLGTSILQPDPPRPTKRLSSTPAATEMTAVAATKMTAAAAARMTAVSVE